jgi:hypothetical protein
MRNVLFVIVFLLNFIFTFSEVSLAQILSVPEGFIMYQVKRGDVLSKIAPYKHFDLIFKVNKIDKNHLPVGKSILIPVDHEKASAFLPVPELIERDEPRILCIFLDRQYFGAYENGKLSFWGPVSSGRKGMDTPAGKFSVKWKNKLYHSKKYNSDMPFAINISNDGVFIHEQALPGRPASHGCIRLLREDAQKIYAWIEKNDPVIIN